MYGSWAASVSVSAIIEQHFQLRKQHDYDSHFIRNDDEEANRYRYRYLGLGDRLRVALFSGALATMMWWHRRCCVVISYFTCNIVHTKPKRPGVPVYAVLCIIITPLGKTFSGSAQNPILHGRFAVEYDEQRKGLGTGGGKRPWKLYEDGRDFVQTVWLHMAHANTQTYTHTHHWSGQPPTTNHHHHFGHVHRYLHSCPFRLFPLLERPFAREARCNHSDGRRCRRLVDWFGVWSCADYHAMGTTTQRAHRIWWECLRYVYCSCFACGEPKINLGHTATEFVAPHYTN